MGHTHPILQFERLEINMKKLLKITTTNKKFVFKNREIRTPVTIEATDSELKYLLVAIKAAGVTDFIIDKVSKNFETKIEESIEVEEEKEVIIEELDAVSEPNSILQKLVREGMENE